MGIISTTYKWIKIQFTELIKLLLDSRITGEAEVSLNFEVFHAERDGKWCDIIVYGSDNVFYHSTFATQETEEAIRIFSTDEIKALDLHFFNTNELKKFFVRFDPFNMTKFTGDFSSKIFVKRQGLTHDIHGDYDMEPGTTFASQLLRREIDMMERVSQHPHPNIAQYLGVYNHPMLGGRYVTDIVYKRYDDDLSDFWLGNSRARTLENAMFILEGVIAGVYHLHNLGIAHHDLRPENIFVKYQTQQNGAIEVTEVVIGDFDAAMEFGTVSFALKHAPMEWWDDNLWSPGRPVDGAPDLHSLEVLADWL